MFHSEREKIIFSTVFLEILSPPLIVPTVQHETWELDNGRDVKLARGKLLIANFHTNQLKGCSRRPIFACLIGYLRWVRDSAILQMIELVLCCTAALWARASATSGRDLLRRTGWISLHKESLWSARISLKIGVSKEASTWKGLDKTPARLCSNSMEKNHRKTRAVFSTNEVGETSSENYLLLQQKVNHTSGQYDV